LQADDAPHGQRDGLAPSLPLRGGDQQGRRGQARDDLEHPVRLNPDQRGAGQAEAIRRLEGQAAPGDHSGRGERHQAGQRHRPVRPEIRLDRELDRARGQVAQIRLLVGRQILATFDTVVPDQGSGTARGEPALVVSPGRIRKPTLYWHAFHANSARTGQQCRPG
jgi:hypothetical protein